MASIYRFLSIVRLFRELKPTDYLIVFIFISLPLKNIDISISTILFIIWSYFFSKKRFNFRKTFFIPISFFVLMASSLLWSYNFDRTLLGIQKQLPFLFIPIAFLITEKVTQERLLKIFRIYSFSITFFAVLLVINAFLQYFKTNDTGVFFYNKLVPSDPGVVYLSVFASFAVFYFIQIHFKNSIEKLSILILAIVIFLLSSKSIITIDFIIIVCYYTFFARIPSSIKTITVLTVSVFLFVSLYFVKEVRERFLMEYETAFIDNTVNTKLSTNRQSLKQVSLKEAWNKSEFQYNDFFPGTALRTYQIRVFCEIVSQNPQIILSGFGLEASQEAIAIKSEEHNINPVYAQHNFHNQYIQCLAEFGIIGLIILIAMLFISLQNAINNKDFLHIAFAITMLMLFLSESFFCRQRGITFFIILFCLFNSNQTKEIQK
ncbi:O-antigen ligase family protein [Flavobacterium sp. CYK-55]|uniref:O-antigen ligase family protein n=1 Tax=Flavobacterium sp. CYK-55 TaxID=2835529 RepID=UPI001BCDDC40|nr:O-antigen ligase family protein [Flavobacterium sp. CYK-55]MBS7787525.1 O-antigen ligase family protein [Flavobacterium sp. CYK-55]